jgi:hypothetical protein
LNLGVVSILLGVCLLGWTCWCGSSGLLLVLFNTSRTLANSTDGASPLVISSSVSLLVLEDLIERAVEIGGHFKRLLNVEKTFEMMRVRMISEAAEEFEEGPKEAERRRIVM